MKNYLSGDACHEKLIEDIKPALAYEKTTDYEAWKTAVKSKFHELIGDLPENRVSADVIIESREKKDDYEIMRFSYRSEEFCRVPAYLLMPNNATKPCPVVICLQGHSTGMHISLGVKKCDGDDEAFPRAAHALNAVANGFAALVIEQRGMGERKSTRTNNDNFTAYSALLLGRTIIGERIWDISCGIDALTAFDNIDTDNITCLGNSGGGTASYYAACFDERIMLAVPSCAVSSYKDSIGDIHHCPCNYIPGVLKWFDMGELACLIAPRKLIVAAGSKDEIFPIKGVKDVYKVISDIYAREGVPDNCELVVTDKGHWFSHDILWPKVVKNTSY